MKKTELVFSSTCYEFTFKSIPKPKSLQNTNTKVFKKFLKNFYIVMIAMLFLIKFINDWEKRLFSKASKVLFLENLLIFRNNWLL